MLPPPCPQFLANIYNRCFSLGYFPRSWKRAEVILILKPVKPEANLASYRPISLLAILSKILERVFLRRVLPVLDEAGLIPDHQLGFRRSHVTHEQCHRIVARILHAFENKRYCSTVFLEVKQAFDRVWHPGLLYKLKSHLPSSHMPYSNRILKEESSKCDAVPQPARQCLYETKDLKAASLVPSSTPCLQQTSLSYPPVTSQQPRMQMTRRSLPPQQTLN